MYLIRPLIHLSQHCQRPPQGLTLTSPTAQSLTGEMGDWTQDFFRGSSFELQPSHPNILVNWNLLIPPKPWFQTGVMGELGLRKVSLREEDSSGEEDPASSDSLEANKQEEELQPDHVLQPTAVAEPPTVSSSELTGETKLIVPSPPVSLTRFELHRSRALGETTTCSSSGQMPDAWVVAELLPSSWLQIGPLGTCL